MPISVVQDSISREQLLRVAREGFGDLVKVVIDVEKGIMAIGGELHADEEVVLMEQYGSKRENTWGVNIYPQKLDKEWIEFDSLINLKPACGNRSRGVESAIVREKIKQIVNKLVSK